MKKNNLKISILILVLAILFVGCNNSEEHMAAFYLKGDADNSVNYKNINETDLWIMKSRDCYTTREVVQTATIEFEGKTYVGEYVDSNVRFLTNYLTDEYKFDSGRFHVDADTGELTVISFYLPLSKEKKITIEQGEKIAVNIAKKYIDVSNYTLDKYESEYNYQYTFEKILGGVCTGEKFSMSLTFDGKIQSLAKIMLGAFPNPDETEKYDERVKELIGAEATELVNNAVKEKYPAVIEYSAPWSITDKWLVLDEDNNICALYKVEIEDTYDKNIVDEYGGIKQTSFGALDFILIK